MFIKILVENKIEDIHISGKKFSFVSEWSFYRKVRNKVCVYLHVLQ